MSKILKFITVWKMWLIVGGAVLLVGIGLSAFGGNGALETTSLTQGDLVRVVRIAGKVIPREKVDLGFETGGTVSYVGKPVGASVSTGEVLLRLEAGSISSQLNKAEAELVSAAAEANKLSGATTYENSLTNAKRNVMQTMEEAFTAASDAVQNKADQMFLDPRSSRPVIAGSFAGYNDLRESLNAGRVKVGDILLAWQKLNETLSNSVYTDQELKTAKQYLVEITAFINQLSLAVNMFEVTTYMSQTTIDDYKADILSARQALNQASQGFIDAEKTLAQVLSDVPVQLGKVEAAQANTDNLRYELSKSTIRSPFPGIISKQEGKLGQAVSAGTVLVSVISPDYLIETYIPEVSIAGVVVGNYAEVTLDAYGDGEKFLARVTRIDPAETVRDGVSTYKTELAFEAPDERIRSGLTTNVLIEIMRKPQVSLLPDRAIVRDGDTTYVYLLDGEEQGEKREVVVGEKDSYGQVEIISGLTPDLKVVLNPETE